MTDLANIKIQINIWIKRDDCCLYNFFIFYVKKISDPIELKLNRKTLIHINHG